MARHPSLPQKMAEDTVSCELFSAEFPANREEYRDNWALVDGNLGDTPI